MGFRATEVVDGAGPGMADVPGPAISNAMSHYERELAVGSTRSPQLVQR
jgi:hypothetical protein